jgi:hypothetical protein
VTCHGGWYRFSGGGGPGPRPGRQSCASGYRARLPRLVGVNSRRHLQRRTPRGTLQTHAPKRRHDRSCSSQCARAGVGPGADQAANVGCRPIGWLGGAGAGSMRGPIGWRRADLTCGNCGVRAAPPCREREHAGLIGSRRVPTGSKLGPGWVPARLVPDMRKRSLTTAWDPKIGNERVGTCGGCGHGSCRRADCWRTSGIPGPRMPRTALYGGHGTSLETGPTLLRSHRPQPGGLSLWPPRSPRICAFELTRRERGPGRTR